MNRKSVFISFAIICFAIICFAIICLAILAGYGVSKRVSDNTNLGVLTLSNVEALADGEKHEHNEF